MLGLSLAGALRRLPVTIPALALLLSAGCDTNVTGSYPADLNYPARTDPIVTLPPEEERFFNDQPGTIEKVIQSIGPKEDGGIGGKALNPNEVPAAKRQELTGELQSIFGTPAAPTVKITDADKAKIIEDLKGDSDLGVTDSTPDPIKALLLDPGLLEQGSGFYRRHCLTCHGLAGDGRGPTGPWVNPHPRDYRKGAFKFISTDPEKIQDNLERKPHRADLIRTLHGGVDGTTMPSFSVLPGEQLESLISYVIHLSIRGEVESSVLSMLAGKEDLLDEDGNPAPEATVATTTRFFLKKTVRSWAKSNLPQTITKPAAYPYGANNESERLASVRRGYELFTNTTLDETPKAFKGAGCISCHQDFGRQVNFKYDQWGTLVRPADLTHGVFRGGRRPIDIYWRIRGGIIPSQMPLVELKTTNPDGSEGDQIDGQKYWDLVNFIQALPFPGMLPKDVRTKVYPEAELPTESQHAAR